MGRQIWDEPLDWGMADGTAVNTTTSETVVYTDYTIGANFMQSDRWLTYTARGRYGATGTPTLRMRMRWGGVAGTTIWDTGTVTCAAVTNALWLVRIDIQTRAIGSVFAMGELYLGGIAAATVGSATGAPALVLGGSAGITVPAAVSVTTTSDQLLSLTATWSASSASNNIQTHQRFIQAHN